ncbi:MAG: hypothetical protein ACFFE6_04425 [Candidatus Thorarchaeota archaeon]
MSEDTSDRVIVSQDNLARCKWCGTPESPYWTISKSEKLYCTPECMLADESSSKRITGIGGICFGTLLIIPFIASIFLQPEYAGGSISLLINGMVLLAIGVAQYAEANEGQKYKDRKDSYRGVSPIICSYCSHQNSPHFTTCQNCGAPLSYGSYSKETMPPWLRKTIPSGVFKCPYCAAIYSYRQASRTHEGLVTCQNCARPFAPAEPTKVEPQSRYFY